MKTGSSKPEKLNGKGLRIAIILSRYNDSIGAELLRNTRETLMANGVVESDISILRVPGALELPLTAKLVAKKKYDAIITLGVIIRGETYHFELVANETYRGLMTISLENEIPVIFGVIAANTAEQAKDRVSKSKFNKGKEYAESAIEMAMILNQTNLS
jgi:6,7-dimethyl-8-ribityllumazine synthase